MIVAISSCLFKKKNISESLQHVYLTYISSHFYFVMGYANLWLCEAPGADLVFVFLCLWFCIKIYSSSNWYTNKMKKKKKENLLFFSAESWSLEQIESWQTIVINTYGIMRQIGGILTTHWNMKGLKKKNWLKVMRRVRNRKYLKNNKWSKCIRPWMT